MKKSYSSLEQINHDLHILRIEREIHYQKINLALDQLKEETSPEKLIKNTLGTAGSLLKNSGSIQTLIATSIFRFFMRRKFKK
ncbi:MULTISPECIES: DUF6327 family protein [unclassified Myroides]|uniref:DUF6327 family protein n=1 Tax=unclassified Myroides TaxID=2642485 RepID=UPI0015FC6239|nr:MULTISPECIES: DUF6327 family protein [unclassified Myroides]MBB1149274.1 hypothetical protein [Myroides sp. NP-2]MDM1406895.1 hypothetical protein [Myroides sp. DF42-4-2]